RRVQSWLAGWGGWRGHDLYLVTSLGHGPGDVERQVTLLLLLDRSPGWRSDHPPRGGRCRRGKNDESWPIHSLSTTGRWRSPTAAERSMGGRTRWPRSHGQSSSATATSRPTCG